MGWAVAIAGALLCLAAMAGCGFCIHAGLSIERYRPKLAAVVGVWEPDVTLLKPLHGDEPELAASLSTFLRQDYAGGVEMRLGVQRADDPALALARRLAAEDGRVRVVADATVHGANAKASNLVNLERAAPPSPLVVQSDSDIAVPSDYLRRLAAALAEEGVGLASCLYVGAAAGEGLAGRLGAMFVSYSQFPLFAVGVALGATPAMGSTLALRRETLEAVDGFAAVKDVLADDYEMGARVRALGLRTVVPPMLVTHLSTESSLAELWRHEVRWSKTVGDIDRAGHLGSVVTHPVPLALLGAALLRFALPGLVILALALVVRLWLKSRVDRVARSNGRAAATGPWWLLPVRDMMSFAVFLAALFARRVDWRGARFHVARDGGLTPV